MAVYSIKDLEHLSGIKAHTIRIWEQRHNIFSPQRTDTNIRFYNDDDLKLILNISLLKNHGIKISKIVQMSHAEMHETIIKITDGSHSYEDQVNSLTVAMLDMDESLFNFIISNNIKSIGFTKTMTEIIYPFFSKIGILWIANSINPAQEHFISNLVRQRVIVETEKLTPNPKFPAFILFLPEEELHELGLLYANYVLREQGFRTFYLGQSLPIKDLEEVYHTISPEYLFTVLTSKPVASKIQSYINDLSKKFKQSQVLITGQQIINRQIDLPVNIRLIKDFSGLNNLVEDPTISIESRG